MWHRASFWQPLQPWFVKETAVFLCKGTKPENSAKPNSRTVCRFPLLRLETPILSTALCKSSRIRRKPNSGTVRRFSPLKPAFFSGLWLGAFGRSRLYRCQSVPGPPMPCFCGTELRFGSLCNLGLSKKLRFFFAKAQNCKKLRFLRLYAGVLWRNLVFAFGKARQTLLFAK